MTETEIMMEIHKIIWQIDTKQGRIDELKNKINILEVAMCEVSNKKREFVDLNDRNNHTIHSILTYGANVPFAKELYNSLRFRINGIKYKKALNSYDLLNQRIKAKIKEYEKEILFLRSGISVMNTKITKLRKMRG